MFKIEKNIPIPKICRPGRNFIYPFNEMEVGDSFFVPLNGEKKTAVQASIVNSAARRKEPGGKRFTTRYMAEEDGIRCWRIN